MNQFYIYFVLFPALWLADGGGPWLPPAGVQVIHPTAGHDHCQTITEYMGTQKVLEGDICDGRREGIWRVWSASGHLRDSAMYIAGERSDIRSDASPVSRSVRGSLDFRGHPRLFYKDSTYECAIRVNASHGMREIKGDYAGVMDTVYPPLFYFGADLGARDSFNYYFIPKTTGKYKLRISLAGDAGKAAGDAAFYEKDIEIVKK